MDFSKEEPNLPSDSDDSDEDYVPSGAESNPPSEVESDGDEEEPPESDEETQTSKKRKKGQKVAKKKARKKDRRQASSHEDTSTRGKSGDEDDDDGKKPVNEEDEKKHADSLWADFMSDTKTTQFQKKKVSNNSKNDEKEEKIIKDKGEPKKEEKENKVTITEVFEFAGEEVKVTKEVDAASQEAVGAQAVPKAVGSGSSGTPGRGRGRGAGGLSSVLGQLGKKSKIGTLEKSKLDWDRFKRTEGIEDEIRTFNRGKEGYLEKQDFLQRTDLRQFEIEKALRATRRSNR